MVLRAEFPKEASGAMEEAPELTHVPTHGRRRFCARFTTPCLVHCFKATTTVKKNSRGEDGSNKTKLPPLSRPAPSTGGASRPAAEDGEYSSSTMILPGFLG